MMFKFSRVLAAFVATAFLSCPSFSQTEPAAPPPGSDQPPAENVKIPDNVERVYQPQKGPKNYQPGLAPEKPVKASKAKHHKRKHRKKRRK